MAKKTVNLIQKIGFSLFLLCLSFQRAASAIDNLENNGLPHFLIIGAQKSGTRALYTMLCQHPQVINRRGEIHFFDLHFEEGLNWYKAQFPEATHSRFIRGDKSPYYLFHPLVPERAYSVVPKAKIVILLRNPVDRAYSQYQMNLRNEKETLSFSEAIQAEKKRLTEDVTYTDQNKKTPYLSNHRDFSYLSRGVEQIKRWLHYYPPEQMMIIASDDLLTAPQQVMKELLEFLDLPRHTHFNFKTGIIHSYPPMDPILRQKLVEHFSPYNQELEQLLNRKFNWE